MQVTQDTVFNDEASVRELVVILWSHKLFIAVFCAVAIFYSAFYALNAKKEYTATAIFKLGQQSSSALNIGGELGMLASIVGMGGGQAGSLNFSKDLVNGRVFVEQLDAQLNFKSDPFFNKYNPNYVDPSWKATIKWLLGYQTNTGDPYEKMWQGILTNYNKFIFLKQLNNGTIKISVRHDNALRAALVANSIMDKIISNLRDKKYTEQDEQLDFLSLALAKSLNDLELSQSKLKTFALRNSALPLEKFAVGSLQLDALRTQLSRTSELYDAVAELSSLLQKNSIAQEDYLSLRQQFPIVDQVEFRRVLGQNEIISSWSWPDKKSVAAVFATLLERKNRLQSQIDASQIDAERYGRAVESYAKLKRETTIAEATYKILIEQVKAQSMMSGFRPDRSEVYEYAAPPVSPSFPMRKQVVLLGALFGLFAGCVLALIFGLFRGVCYSQKSLEKFSKAYFNVSYKSLIPLQQQSLRDLKALLTNKPRSALRDLTMEINKSGKTHVTLTSSLAKITANNAARAIATYMQSEPIQIAIVDFSHKGKKPVLDAVTSSSGSFSLSEKEGQVSVFLPDSDLEALDLLSQRDFLKNLNSLSATFDMIFLCADNIEAISLLRVLEGQKTFHLTIARRKHTKSKTLSKMHSLFPIQGLLYD